MRKKYDMTETDRAELADIEAAAAIIKLRRRRFFGKLRQREYTRRKAG